MRIFRQRSAGEEAAIHARAEWIVQELEGLPQKTPEEVAGTDKEPLYYIFRLSATRKHGTPDETREFAAWMVRRFPFDSSVRVSVALTLWELGDEAEAIAQLGILLALDPKSLPVHKVLSRFLRERGEREAAERILGNGRRHVERQLPRRDREEQRERYFHAGRHRHPSGGLKHGSGE
jgi:predicted Zn-dependent protease